ncbi:MAG: HAMP domain-containing histidine kinase [Anaerotignum sp.]|nr:HAMP domain-containing histidine kinase [Anaerotignum sp.]
MKKLTHNLGMKVIACFLVIISGFMMVGSGVGAYYAYENGFYGDNAKPYHKTASCQHITFGYSSGLIDHIHTNAWSSYDQEAFAPENTNYRYRILSANSEVLMENLNAEEHTVLVEKNTFTLYPVYVEENHEVMKEAVGDAEMAEVVVEGYIVEPPVVSDDYSHTFRLHQKIYDIHDVLIPVFGFSTLIFALCLVFLLCAAGHQAGKEEIVLNIQDKLPLDLYLLFTVGGSLGIGIMMLDGNPFNRMEAIIVGVIGILIISILVLATILTMATRIKLGRYFYQNTICYRLLRLCGKVFTWFLDALKAIPLMWKVAVAWLLISCIYIIGELPAVLLNLAFLFLFCSIAAQMRRLEKGGEELAKGNLKNKVDTQRMFPLFRKHGEHLNSVSKGFAIALNQKMKSERLKTELITNVSHDIKTPLTSIINYVDLLKKEELPEKALEYVEVLDRQSNRLKKLTEDLVEASKATTGNIKANLAPTDLVELVTQAIAEYEEKLNLANLEPVVYHNEPSVFAMVDGNLTWRVMSNLLSNVCKYSQPGTRVYIDIMKEDDMIALSVKNISKDALNIPVDELMERFVRGDSSRHTEGSGLGLNIAQSLVHLQKGKFTLKIDGDLFKVDMMLPAAEMPLDTESADI